MNAEQNPSQEISRGNRIIKTSGEEVPMPAPQNGTDYTLEELSSFIGGGLIEILEIDSETFMILDDSFRAKRLPFNVAATWMFAPVAVDRGMFSTYPILGDVAIIAKSQIW